MADENPPMGSFGSGEDPGHETEASWRALQGDMGPVFTQPAGIDLDEGEPASAAGTSEAPESDVMGWVYELPEGTSGGAAGAVTANAREDNQKDVF